MKSQLPRKEIDYQVNEYAKPKKAVKSSVIGVGDNVRPKGTIILYLGQSIAGQQVE